MRGGIGKGLTVAAMAMMAALAGITPASAGIDRVDGPVPVTATSRIYNAAAVPGALPQFDLAAHDYVEEEYFLLGTADAYRHASGDALAVIAKDVPYGTRIIIRRPRSAANFSGIVHFEPIHPSQGGTSHWFATAPYMMKRGDAYVAAGLGDDASTRAISKKGPVPTAQSQLLHWFDADRYGPLKWPEEDGIRYMVMGDIGALLRSDRPDNPLKGLKVRRILVGGWSFTGSVQRTFINEGFHDRARLPDGKPVFDGYLIGISSRWNGGGYIPLNNAEDKVANDDPRRTLRAIDVPVIEFLSEFEVATGPGPQQPDSDAMPGAHRLYELGGVIHGSSQVDGNPPRNKRPNLVQLAEKGYPLNAVRGEEAGNVCPLPVSDVPHPAFARAALDNLRLWTEEGTPPPRAPQLQWTADGKIARDAAGNPMGGIPVAEFQQPLASYGLYRGDDQPACVATSGRPIFLRQNIGASELKARYGSASRYEQAYDAAVDALVRQRWLLPDDAALLKAKTKEQAEAQFTP